MKRGEKRREEELRNRRKSRKGRGGRRGRGGDLLATLTRLRLIDSLRRSARPRCRILFCFRQRDDRRPTEVNPLAPHYLVYVLDDGNVRLTFAQSKQSLEVFRTLAAGQSSPLNNLCDLFDDRTGNGTNMAHENHLLERAVESIKATFGKRAAASLFAGRDAVYVACNIK